MASTDISTEPMRRSALPADDLRLISNQKKENRTQNIHGAATEYEPADEVILLACVPQVDTGSSEEDQRNAYNIDNDSPRQEATTALETLEVMEAIHDPNERSLLDGELDLFLVGDQFNFFDRSRASKYEEPVTALPPAEFGQAATQLQLSDKPLA